MILFYQESCCLHKINYNKWLSFWALNRLELGVLSFNDWHGKRRNTRSVNWYCRNRNCRLTVFRFVSGYAGKTCEKETDPCASTPCQNGATCSGNVTQFLCQCPKGFSGPLCQHNLNVCESSPCVHGICVDQEDGYKCFCQQGEFLNLFWTEHSFIKHSICCPERHTVCLIKIVRSS